MSILFFWFVYFPLDDLYKVKAVFILVLVRTIGKHKFYGNLISVIGCFVNRVCDFNGIVYYLPHVQ